jgi:hypothetical protein
MDKAKWGFDDFGIVVGCWRFVLVTEWWKTTKVLTGWLPLPYR